LHPIHGKLAGWKLRPMTHTSFIQHLKDRGFTHITFDMASGCSITAWRGSQRKTYSTYGSRTLADAEAKLLAEIEAMDRPKVEPAKPPSDFDDILG
jgi:hypothetical protein